MKLSHWTYLMMSLALHHLVQGQVVTFDTVQFNTVNSFLLATSVFETDSGYLAFGTGGDGTGTVQDQRSFLFDQDGGLQQVLTFGSHRLTDSGAFGPVAKSAMGGYVSGVVDFGNGISIDSLYLFRYDAQGDTIWTRYLSADTTLAIRKCIETANGDIVMVGLHYPPRGAFMFRVTSQGDSIHFVNFGEPAFYPMSVVEDEEGNLLMAGYTSTAIPQFQFRSYLLKCTPEGEVIWWRARPAGSGYGGLTLTNDGCVVAFGKANNEDDFSGALMVKYASDGTEVWVRDQIIFADSETRVCSFLNGYQQSDGSLIICGTIRNTVLDLFDKGMLYKFDAEGNETWSRFYSHYSGIPVGYPQEFYDVKPTSDGGFILTGETNGPAPPNSHRLWLVKLDSMGCLVPGCHTVGVQEFESQLQSALKVSPNPANERVQVSLALPEGYRLEGAVQALLLDAQGKEVLRAQVPTNTTELRGQLDVSGLPSGLYYLHLRDATKWLAGGKVVVSAP
ncbi:MAG: T9SS type A sorting domain-containing protein [Flavobacteriales bacterium]|nr:T9SS type A sorting domain-containing protein [Flavobacteriales bacterium]